MRRRVGLLVLAVAVVALALTLRPYGRYVVTNNPGCTPDGACGSPSFAFEQCPSIAKSLPAELENPAAGEHGVQQVDEGCGRGRSRRQAAFGLELATAVLALLVVARNRPLFEVRE